MQRLWGNKMDLFTEDSDSLERSVRKKGEITSHKKGTSRSCGTVQFVPLMDSRDNLTSLLQSLRHSPHGRECCSYGRGATAICEHTKVTEM